MLRLWGKVVFKSHMNIGELSRTLIEEKMEQILISRPTILNQMMVMT